MSVDLIDTHCHLNIAESFPDPVPAIREAMKVGVRRLIMVGVDLATSRRAVAIAEERDGLFAVVGHHPNYTADYTADEIPIFRELLKHPKVVALGEIGLDFHWQNASHEQQYRALHEQLDLAAEVGCPVVFHCREAYGELITVLQGRPPHKYLFHCYSGGEEHLQATLDLGCTFGFDGPLTYKKSQGLRDLVAKVPRDRIVLETDSPYLSPEPFRGKPNEPAYLPYINRALAQALAISEEESAAITTLNAKRFFGLVQQV